MEKHKYSKYFYTPMTSVQKSICSIYVEVKYSLLIVIRHNTGNQTDM